MKLWFFKCLREIFLPQINSKNTIYMRVIKEELCYVAAISLRLKGTATREALRLEGSGSRT